MEEFVKELESAAMVDAITLSVVPPPEIVEESNRRLASAVTVREETFRASISGITVRGYLASDLSPNDPYIVVETADPISVAVVINSAHPHWSQLKGSEGVLNYLRHCTYDAIAEWQAKQRVGRIDTDTIKLLKDRLLRVPFEMEMQIGSSESVLAQPENNNAG